MKLSIVIGTYNRIGQIKNCLESVFRETSIGAKVYITDAGSTDGTIDYLKSIASDKVIPIFAGKKLGQAKAYNDVFNLIDTPYACWLSDDNVIVNRGLDIALDILENDSGIGMVALKVKDLEGPFTDAPYIGGISSIGILNVNQGMLPTAVLKKVGGFSEEFQDYGIDPDITAKVLFAGYKIVYTKKVAIHHYRNWATDTNSEEYDKLQKKHRRYYELYNEKYLRHTDNGKTDMLRQGFIATLKKISSTGIYKSRLRKKSVVRDFNNILQGKYISFFDFLLAMGKDYHLVQSLRKKST